MSRYPFLAALAVTILAVGPGRANLPPEYIITAEIQAPGPVSILTVPDGSGFAASWAMVFGGVWVDATITVTVLDDQSQPIAGIAGDDFWLIGSLDGVRFCANGTAADHETDAAGRTTFSFPFRGGGACDRTAGEHLQLVVMGFGPYDITPFEVFTNSPDINGDETVNLSDVVAYTMHIQAGYDYAADFYWDGVLNLSDVVFMAQALGASCP